MSDNITLSVTVEDEKDLRPAGHPREPLFQAYKFKVTEQIGRTYLLRVAVFAYVDNLDLSALVGRHMVLTESRTLDGNNSGTPSERSRDFKGVIWSAQQRGQNLGLGIFYYWLDVRPAVHSLSMTERCQVYGTDDSRSIPELIHYCLTGSYKGSGSGLDPIKASIKYKTDYDSRITYNTPSMKTDFTIQYNETDLNFMSRLMEKWGIFYFFNPYQRIALETEEIIISDYNSSFRFAGNANSIDEAVTLNYVQPTKYAPGSTYKVKNFIARQSLRSKTLTLDDYNYHTAAKDLTASATLDSTGEGTLTRYGEDFATTGTGSDGEVLSSRQGELIMSDQAYFTGQSDCFELLPGYIFALEGHFNPAYDTNKSAKSRTEMHGYLVTEVAHECSVPLPGQSWNDEDYGHSADFTALECCVPYRLPKVTPVPKAAGVVSATIDSAEEIMRADLDHLGSYLIWLKFDVSGLPDGQHSSRVRMVQPYGGPRGGGLMFPISKGTEVLVSFVNGDFDRPIILGAAPNSSHPSPVKKRNETQGIIQTDSRIRLEYDDGVLGTPTHRTLPGDPPVGAPPETPDGGDAKKKIEEKVEQEIQSLDIKQKVETAIENSDIKQKVETALEDGLPDEYGSPSNWVRLYLMNNMQKTYLRMGATPKDEGTVQLPELNKYSLASSHGWLDFTDGDRASGTGGDKAETVAGDCTDQVGGDRTDKVGGKHLHQVKGSHDVEVGGSRHQIEVKNNFSMKVGKVYNCKVQDMYGLTVLGFSHQTHVGGLTVSVPSLLLTNGLMRITMHMLFDIRTTFGLILSKGRTRLDYYKTWAKFADLRAEVVGQNTALNNNRISITGLDLESTETHSSYHSIDNRNSNVKLRNNDIDLDTSESAISESDVKLRNNGLDLTNNSLLVVDN